MTEENKEMKDGLQQEQEEIKEEKEVSSKEEESLILKKEIEELRKRVDNKEDFIRKQQSRYDKLMSEINSGKSSLEKTSEIANKPLLSNYNNEEEYFSDLVKWELGRTDIKNKIREELKVSTEHDKIYENKKKFDREAERLNEEVKDFDQVAKSETMLNIYSTASNNLGIILESMENGPRIAYYLGKNIDEAHKLSSLSSHELLPELVKLDKKSKPKTSTNTTTNISPIDPVSGTKGTISNKPTHKMTTQEWVEHRRKMEQ